MPAENTRERLKIRDRQRRGVHAILIAALNLEVGKIGADGGEIVDFAVWVFRTVGVPVDEVRHLQISRVAR